jgi:hypothetical protein
LISEEAGGMTGPPVFQFPFPSHGQAQHGNIVMVKHRRVPPQECPFASYAEEIRQQFQQDNEPDDDAQDKQEAERFLQKLRPGGPWVLTAIVPDGDTVTNTVHNASEIEAFIREHDGKRNIYYAVNPLRREMSKKAAKTDAAAIEYALADLDPDEGESSDAAKARYLTQLNGGSFKPRPTTAVDSGNGLQCLWRLKDLIALGKPVRVQVKDKKTGKLVWKLRFEAADQAAIDDVEERIKAIMLRLGAKPGTQNIDRILRLPGTTNLPNAKKRKDGRVPCPTKLMWFDDGTFPLDAFPKPASSASAHKTKSKGTDHEDPLEQLIHDDSVPKGKRSEQVWFVICKMLRRGYQPKAILRVLLDRGNAISAHIYDQPKPEAYAERQIAQAIGKIDFIRDKEGKKILPIVDNIRVAMIKLGVGVRYDRFGDRIMLDGLPGFGPALEDAAVHRLWLTFGQRFSFYPALELTRIVVNDAAQLNGFHPVRDYLDALQWDGKPRVDRWLTTYAGAEDSDYTRAVGALQLIAAVRRIRQPGCKFDEMLIFEQPTQGTDKSSALAILAVNDDWFTDDLPLNVDSKRVIEAVRGRWIVECAELSGMKKADIAHLTAMLSRRVDRARMAYGRLPVDVPRQFVPFGTTNKTEYLRDTTGNRRFWPVRMQRFDLAALRRDRDQLWAEAVAREAKGESIRLRRELWPLAAREQRQRLADDRDSQCLSRRSRRQDQSRRRLDHPRSARRAAESGISNAHGGSDEAHRLEAAEQVGNAALRRQAGGGLRARQPALENQCGAQPSTRTVGRQREGHAGVWNVGGRKGRRVTSPYGRNSLV